MKITIVIPCFNESESLPKLIESLKAINSSFKFIIVDNGSTDNTQEIISQLEIPNNIEFIKKEINTGYGAGIKYGLKSVKSEYAGWMHGDLQQDPNVLLNAKKLIESFKDQGIKELIAFKGLRKGRSIKENLFTSGVALLSSILFFNFFWDIAGQPTIFKASILNFLDNAPDDHNFEFYVYINFLSKKGNFKRFNAPFSKRKFGVSSWDKGLRSKLNHANSVFKYLLKLRFNS